MLVLFWLLAHELVVLAFAYGDHSFAYDTYDKPPPVREAGGIRAGIVTEEEATKEEAQSAYPGHERRKAHDEEEAPAGESLFDDDEVAAYKNKQEGKGGAGESLFDDDEIAAFQNKQAEGQDSEASEQEVSFDSKEKKLTTDLAFDERGNVKEGGHPDIAFWHVSEFNGERIDEPTHGSRALLEALEGDGPYAVKFAPPSFSQFQCTEKVQGILQIFESYSHELSEELLQRAAATLAVEGVTNSKQLGELDEKDYDAIHIPALIKTRLRKVRAEARAQTEVADTKVEMDSKEVQDEVNAYMNARETSRGGEEANKTQVEAAEVAKPAEMAAPAAEEEEDGTFKSLVWAVMNCPTCKGKETITCFRNCRYKVVPGKEDEKRSWGDCLDECIENRWLRATFYAMLPRS